MSLYQLRSPFSHDWLLIETESGDILAAKTYAWPGIPHAADQLAKVMLQREAWRPYPSPLN